MCNLGALLYKVHTVQVYMFDLPCLTLTFCQNAHPMILCKNDQDETLDIEYMNMTWPKLLFIIRVYRTVQSQAHMISSPQTASHPAKYHSLQQDDPATSIPWVQWNFHTVQSISHINRSHLLRPLYLNHNQLCTVGSTIPLSF